MAAFNTRVSAYIKANPNLRYVAPKAEMGGTEIEFIEPGGNWAIKSSQFGKEYTMYEAPSGNVYGTPVDVFNVKIKKVSTPEYYLRDFGAKTKDFFSLTSSEGTRNYPIVSYSSPKLSYYSGYSQPSIPSSPSYPSRPSYPSTPSKPSYPSKISTLSYPSYPSYPSRPSYPSYPSYPSKPSVPSYPSYPSYPSRPSRPSYPSYRKSPEYKPYKSGTKKLFISQKKAYRQRTWNIQPFVSEKGRIKPLQVRTKSSNIKPLEKRRVKKWI
jgi:hypothetical protein